MAWIWRVVVAAMLLPCAAAASNDPNYEAKFMARTAYLSCRQTEVARLDDGVVELGDLAAKIKADCAASSAADIKASVRQLPPDQERAAVATLEGRVDGEVMSLITELRRSRRQMLAFWVCASRREAEFDDGKVAVVAVAERINSRCTQLSGMETGLKSDQHDHYAEAFRMERREIVEFVLEARKAKSLDQVKSDPIYSSEK